MGAESWTTRFRLFCPANTEQQDQEDWEISQAQSALAHSAKGEGVLRERRKFELKHQRAYLFHGNKKSAYDDVPKGQRAETIRGVAIKNQIRIKASYRAFGNAERGVMKKKVMPWADRDELLRRRLRNFVERFKRTTKLKAPVIPDWTRAKCEEVFRSAKNIGVDRKSFRLMCEAIDAEAAKKRASSSSASAAAVSGRERARLQHLEKLRQRHEREAKRKATQGIKGAKALELLKNRQIDRELYGVKGREALAAVKNRQPEDPVCNHECESFRTGSVVFKHREVEGRREYYCLECGCRAIRIRSKSIHPKPVIQDDIWSGLTDMFEATATSTDTDKAVDMSNEVGVKAQECRSAAVGGDATSAAVPRTIAFSIVRKQAPKTAIQNLPLLPESLVAEADSAARVPVQQAPQRKPDPVAPAVQAVQAPPVHVVPPAPAVPVPPVAPPVAAAPVQAAPAPVVPPVPADHYLSGYVLTAAQAEGFAEQLGHPLRRHSRNVIPYSHERRLVTNRNVKETKEAIEMAYIELDDEPLIKLPELAWWQDRAYLLKLALTTVLVLAAIVTLVLTFLAYPEVYFSVFMVGVHALLWFIEQSPLFKCLVIFTITLLTTAIAIARWLLKKPTDEVWPRVMIYCPHMVSCALSEYRRGTNVDVAMATMRQKMLRLATLPIPDFDAAQILDGSEQVALYLIKDQDFAGRAPICHALAATMDVL